MSVRDTFQPIRLEPAGTERHAVLLLGHGSRDADGAAEFRAFVDYFGRQRPHQPVLAAFLELADPTVAESVARLRAQGATRILALPLFLFGARHVKSDVPAEIDDIRAAHPDVDLRYGAPLGVAPELVHLAIKRFHEAQSELPPAPIEATAVILVEAGSSDPDANSNVFKVARLVWEGLRCLTVEPCFISVTRPALPETIRRTVNLGARRVVVVPYFLFTGILCKRIARVVRRDAPKFPDTELVVARHLGQDQLLVDLTARRLHELVEGEVRMSCDLCKYRVRFAGFDHQHGSAM